MPCDEHLRPARPYTSRVAQWRARVASREERGMPPPSGRGALTGREVTTHSGPVMPPSLRMRQKWIAIRKPVASGKPTTCST